jgi:ABC-type multidrug transport system fused ATPase/permease subunit
MPSQRQRSAIPRLLSYASPYRDRIALYLGLSISIALLELSTPWPMKLIIDSVVGSEPLPGIVHRLLPESPMTYKYTVLALALTAGLGLKLAASALLIQATRAGIDVRQRMLLALKSDLFQHLQRQSFAFHDSRRLGESMFRINNDAHGIDSFVTNVLQLITAAMTLVGMFWIVVTLDWQLAVLSALVAPFLYWSVNYYWRRFTPKVHKVQEMEAESMSIAQESFSNLRVVKAFTREEHEYERFVDQGRAAMDARVTLTVQQTMFAITVGLITTAGTLAVLGVGALHALAGSLTVGALVVVLAYLASLYGPVAAVSATLSSVRIDVAKAERVFELLDAEPDVTDRPGAVALHRAHGHVRFEGARFGYRDDLEVLHDINLDVPPGRVIGIVGTTGAGKTSLVSLIPRFYDVTGGRVSLDGLDVRDVQLASLRRQISLVFQDTILFSTSLRENIAYGRPDATADEIVEAAKTANAHEFIMALPERYETQVGERGVKLSGGERQRIAIARAFLKDAPVLILDEPTSSVDSRTEAVILKTLEALMRGRTTFIIAHRLSTLRLADEIVVVEHGLIVERGSHDHLVRAGNAYAAFYHAQAVGGTTAVDVIGEP